MDAIRDDTTVDQAQRRLRSKPMPLLDTDS